jgi:hypothetical protein
VRNTLFGELDEERAFLLTLAEGLTEWGGSNGVSRRSVTCSAVGMKVTEKMVTIASVH